MVLALALGHSSLAFGPQDRFVLVNPEHKLQLGGQMSLPPYVNVQQTIWSLTNLEAL